MSPEIIFVRKNFLVGLFSGRLPLFSSGLAIGGDFAFQNGLGLTIETANPSSPWLVSEIWGVRLIFRRAYNWRGFFLSESYGMTL